MTKNTLVQILQKDYSEKRNIGTFTSVYRNPHLHEYIDYYLNKNFVDKKAYRSLDYLKETIISPFFTNVFHNTDGAVLTTSGSTESILLALFYAREKAAKEKNITNPNIIIGSNAHYSIHNCARFLNIHVKYVGLTDTFTLATEEVRTKIDRNTILIVGTLGTTELGVIDDLQELNKIAGEYNISLHVDAAIGGFILPFIEKDLYTFDSLSHMTSLNISGHKFGLALPGSGILLVKDQNVVEDHGGEIHYLSSGKAIVENLLISSHSLGVLSLGINILDLGEKRYTAIAKNYNQTKEIVVKNLEKLGLSVFSGSKYTPSIFIYGDQTHDLSQYLTHHQWIQHTYKAKGLEQKGIRIVVKKDQEELLKTTCVNDITCWQKQYQSSERSVFLNA